jgi:hypothetical protein
MWVPARPSVGMYLIPVFGLRIYAPESWVPGEGTWKSQNLP